MYPQSPEDTQIPAISLTEYQELAGKSDISLLLSLADRYPLAEESINDELETQELEVEERSYSPELGKELDRQTAETKGRLHSEASIRRAERRAKQRTLRLSDHMIVSRVARMTSQVIGDISPVPQSPGRIPSSREVGHARETGIQKVKGAKATFEESRNTNSPLGINTDPYLSKLKDDGIQLVAEALGNYGLPARLPRDEAKEVMNRAKVDQEFAAGLRYALSIYDIFQLEETATPGAEKDELTRKRTQLELEENQRRQRLPKEEAQKAKDGQMRTIDLIKKTLARREDSFQDVGPRQLEQAINDISIVYSYMVNGE